MRFVIGGIVHETHTFSAEPATLASFNPARGNELLAWAGTNHSLGGTLDACREFGIEALPTLFASAVPCGAPSRTTFDALVTELCDRIAAELPADGVVLNLHGAMVAENVPDAEAVIAARVRETVGQDVPIAVTLDFHANIGQAMIDAVDVVTTYDTYPHVDAADRAREAVELLHRTVIGTARPTMAMVKLPLMPVPQAQFTARPPFATIFERAFEMECTPGVLSVTVAGGFAYSDVPVVGMSLVVTTDNDPTLARQMANDLANLAWGLREQMLVTNVDPIEAVRQAIAASEGPIVLVDVGDNVGGGSPGDGTVLLSELIRQGADQAVVVIADPESVRAAWDAGAGASVTISVGGKVDRLHGPPCLINGIVTKRYDGKWVHEGPENAGVPVDMGPSAVVQIGGISVVLTTLKSMPGDLQQLRSAGIEPTSQRIIVVKAAVRWRGGFGPIAKGSIDVDTPGLGSVHLDQFDFKAIPRPIFPLDMETTWP